MSVVMGNGCGPVGKAIASHTGGLRFESSHRQFFKEHSFTVFKRRKQTKGGWEWAN